jgi:hypothetical protein
MGNGMIVGSALLVAIAVGTEGATAVAAEVDLIPSGYRSLVSAGFICTILCSSDKDGVARKLVLSAHVRPIKPSNITAKVAMINATPMNLEDELLLLSDTRSF